MHYTKMHKLLSTYINQSVLSRRILRRSFCTPRVLPKAPPVLRFTALEPLAGMGLPLLACEPNDSHAQVNNHIRNEHVHLRIGYLEISLYDRSNPDVKHIKRSSSTAFSEVCTCVEIVDVLSRDCDDPGPWHSTSRTARTAVFLIGSTTDINSILQPAWALLKT